MSVKMVTPYEDMGRIFAQQECFEKEKVTEFAAPEYFSKSFQIFSQIITPIQKLMFKHIAKSVGCKEKLDVKPYQDYAQALNHKKQMAPVGKDV